MRLIRLIVVTTISLSKTIEIGPDADVHVLQNVVNFMYCGETPKSGEYFDKYLTLGQALSVKCLPLYCKSLPPMATEDRNLKMKCQDREGDQSPELAPKPLHRDSAVELADRDQLFETFCPD